MRIALQSAECEVPSKEDFRNPKAKIRTKSERNPKPEPRGSGYWLSSWNRSSCHLLSRVSLILEVQSRNFGPRFSDFGFLSALGPRPSGLLTP